MCAFTCLECSICDGYAETGLKHEGNVFEVVTNVRYFEIFYSGVVQDF